MTPFDANPDNDAGHTINQEDLIAFHLHELTPAQERAIHRVLRTDPALQAESLAIAAVLHAFPKHEASLPLDAAAPDRHWQAILPSLTPYVPLSVATLSRFKFQLPRWALPTVAALAATACVIALHRDRADGHFGLATIDNPTTIQPSSNSPRSDSTTRKTPPSRAVNLPSPPSRATLNHSLGQSITPPPAPPTSATTSETNATPIVPTPSPSTSNSSAAAGAGTTASPAPLVATTQLPLSAQPDTPQTSLRNHHDHTTDVALAVIGNLTPDRSFTSTGAGGASAAYTQETTPSIGALAAFHQQLRLLVGYRITAAYSEPTFQYVYRAPEYSGSGNIINQHVYELSGTYVVQGPHHRRASTSAEAGVGLLAFLPANPNLTAIAVSNAFRPAGVIGASAEFSLTKHIALHLGYRGLFYKAPIAYPNSGATAPAPNNSTFSNEPVIGFTYRFRPTREQ